MARCLSILLLLCLALTGGALGRRLKADDRLPVDDELALPPRGRALLGLGNQCSAKLTTVSFVFYWQVEIDVNCNDGAYHHFSAKMGGFGLPGGGGSFGTFFYEDAASLTGKANVHVASTGLGATSVTLYRPAGHPIGEFVGGAVSTSAGTAGGSGSWK